MSPEIGSSEFSIVRLNRFAKTFDKTHKVKEAFSSIDKTKAVFVNLYDVSVSAGFLREMLKGILPKAPKVIIVDGTEDQNNLVVEVAKELEVVDNVFIM